MEEQRRQQSTKDQPAAGERDPRADEASLVEQEEPLKSHGDKREHLIPRGDRDGEEGEPQRSS